MAVGIAIVLAAVLISFLLYTRQMADVLRRDAAVFTRLYAFSFQASAAQDPEAEERLTDETQFVVLRELGRLQIPAVITDTAGNPTSWANLPFEVDEDEPEDMRRLRDYVRELDAEIPPLESPAFDLQVHFGEPLMLRRLRWIPWLQAAVLLAVVGGGGWLIWTSFRSERERIWSAMARESAHQMGTPLSSLVGWLEQLEASGERRPDRPGDEPPSGGDLPSGNEEPGRAGGGGERGHGGGRQPPPQVDLVGEMQADVARLLKVSHRFELIGRSPDLEPVSLARILEQLRRYFSTRLPTLGRSVRFSIEIPADAPPVRGNATLLEWAFENLIKNSLDALAGRDGEIRVTYDGVRAGEAVFHVRDDGPGVPTQVRGKLFEIGVSTKERGWGVGLSLTRRIIEDMHGGEIQLENTVEGASFRLGLPVAGGTG